MKFMKLKDFLKTLNQLVEENPEYLKLEVITAIDDEGNGYNEILYDPTVGVLKDGELDMNPSLIPTVICVN